jgi:hypothetical protein
MAHAAAPEIAQLIKMCGAKRAYDLRSLPGFIEFAVRRMMCRQPQVNWRTGKLMRQQAVAASSGRWRERADISEKFISVTAAA